MTRIISTEEYLQLQRPNINWLIQDLLPHPGTILLSGPPKSGKSFLAFDLALAVSQGTPFLGWGTRQSKVLYLQFDTSELIWRQRLQRLKASGVSLLGDLYTVHPDDLLLPINIIDPKHKLWLTQVVNQCSPELTVIDVFREIHNADENDSTQMKIVGDIVTEVFKGRSLILVHHSKKIPDDVFEPDPAQVARGSSYLTGKVDALWLLYRNQLHIQSRTEEQRKLKLVQTSWGSWLPKP